MSSFWQSPPDPTPEGPEGRARAGIETLVDSDHSVTTSQARRYQGAYRVYAAMLDAAASDTSAQRDIAERSIRLEVAAALRITEAAAGAMIAQSVALCERYETVLDSQLRAKITDQHGKILVQALDALEPELREALLPDVLALAEAEPVGKFRSKLRELVERARVETLAERHQKALEQRRVHVQPDEDGMAWLMVYLPAVEARAIFGRITVMSKRIADHPDEARSLPQIRADVMGDLLTEGWTDAVAPEARGIRATVAVTVPVLALLGEEESGDAGVATVEGVGPIPLRVARQLCGGAAGWMRVLTHPETGMVLSVGREQYRPPPGLRRLVRWRSATCMAPGCNMTSDRCEIDHNVAWDDGGTTELDNLAPLCKNHHVLKHHGNWTVEQVRGSGGVMRWTSPTGRTYEVEPVRRVVAFVPDASDAPF